MKKKEDDLIPYHGPIKSLKLTEEQIRKQKNLYRDESKKLIENQRKKKEK